MSSLPFPLSVCRRWFLSSFCRAACLPTVCLSMLFWTGPAMAQDEDPPEKPAVKAAEKKTEKKPKEEPAEPESMTVWTKDGVRLSLTYYAGMKGKESVPVVLLHSQRGSHKDFDKLAPFLQKTLGCAVIVPDLRGHGESTTKRISPNKTVPLDAAKMSAMEFTAMVPGDMRAIKDFLRRKNNDKELNLNKLCVVGIDMGAAVALGFAVDDSLGYNDGEGRPFVGPVQVGCFLKAMVLISPEQNVKGLPAKEPLQSPYVRGKIPAMILVGKDNTKSQKEASQIHVRFKASHPAPPEDKKELKTLFFGQFKTSLQGAKLLDEESLGAHTHIREFIAVRLVRNPDAKSLTWKELKLPYQ